MDTLLAVQPAVRNKLLWKKMGQMVGLAFVFGTVTLVTTGCQRPQPGPCTNPDGCYVPPPENPTAPRAQVLLSTAGGTYDAPQTVTISSDDPEATLYYTTSGVYPTTSCNVYDGSLITIGNNSRLQVLLVPGPDFRAPLPAVQEALYTINNPDYTTAYMVKDFLAFVVDIQSTFNAQYGRVDIETIQTDFVQMLNCAADGSSSQGTVTYYNQGTQGYGYFQIENCTRGALTVNGTMLQTVDGSNPGDFWMRGNETVISVYHVDGSGSPDYQGTLVDGKDRLFRVHSGLLYQEGIAGYYEASCTIGNNCPPLPVKYWNFGIHDPNRPDGCPLP